jgi:hypothetical protein
MSCFHGRLTSPQFGVLLCVTFSGFKRVVFAGNMPPRMKKTAYLPAKIEPDLKARLEVMAKKKKVSVSWLVRSYVEAGVKQDERRRK